MRGTDASDRAPASRRGRFALAAALLLAPACRPIELEHPYEESTLKAHSSEPEAERLIQALMRNEVAELQNWMTAELRAQLRFEDISATSDRLRASYGNPIGIVEERTHTEGDLEWFSLLVLHARGKPGSPDRRRRQRLVLYQFALRGELLDRLLVREHLDVRHLKSPARRYTLVTRIHFVSTGEWTVSHGGKRRATNYHHGSRSQRYAYDLVVQKGGRQHGGERSSNKDYYCYGLPVLAPAPGTVVQVIDGIAENRPGERGKAGGNGVVIDHGFGEYSALWHMIPGSVQVKTGDKVQLGQQLGRVGNSGRSTGPHIHYQVSTGDSAGHGIGMQAPFVDVYVDGAWYPRKLPVRGERVRRTKTDRSRAEVMLDASM
ncbi:MAG: M23 family metallopeptidase [Nannocystis sp.]|nr:M23 family metallopeptidase [Nannocystis sp.]MBA3549430.1 M23 family metallopeptidase [Nannocystis sp.]